MRTAHLSLSGLGTYTTRWHTTQMKQRSGFEAKLLATFAATGLVVVGLAIANWFTSQDTGDAMRSLAHTNEVLQRLASTRSDSIEIELSTRQYIASNDAARLVERDAAITAREASLRRIEELTAGNPRQQERLTRVREMADERVRISRQLELLHRTRGSEAAIAYSGSSPLLESRRRLLGLLSEMEVDERRQVDEQTAEQRNAREDRIAATALTTLALIALLLASYALIRRQLRTIKTSHDALARNEDSLSTTLDSIGDAVLSADTAGRITRMNPIAERLTGWPFAEARGRFVAEVLHIVDAQTRERVHMVATEVLADSEIQARADDSLLIARDSTERPVANNAAPIHDDTGKVSGVVIVFRDVTAERQAQRTIREQNERLEQRVQERTARLAEAEAKLRNVIDNAPALIAYADSQQRYVYACRAYIEYFSPGQRRIDGRTEREVLGEERYAIAGPRIAEVLQGRPQQYDWQPGPGVWQAVICVPQRDADDRIVGYYELISDITERKQAQQRIQRQLEHLRLLDKITRSTGERQDLKSIFGVVVRSLEDELPIDFGCVCLHDAAANTLTVTSVGVKSEALAHELMMPERGSIDIDENGLSHCVQGQLVYEPDISQVAFPFPERLARGGLRAVVMAPLKLESRVFGILIAARHAADAFTSAECEFLRQLSEHVALAASQAQIYQSLQQAYDDLRQTRATAMQEERLRALGQMASGIAHDINNALSPVSLYTESLLETEQDLSERGRGHLETIQRGVDDVAKTLARLRDFYRQREAQIELAPVDVNQMVRQVLDLTKAHWSDSALRRGITIQVVTELAPDLPRIMGVDNEIREALTNLVFNAVDAMPGGGTLALRAWLAGAAPDQSVIVEVVDSGIGMDEETRRRCLEPFFTTKGERGTGLGLPMVFGMAQRHNAGIEIDSAPDAGTTVRLMFPVQTTVLVEPGRTVTVLDAPRHLRLLLVDDDPVLLDSLRNALEIDGHMVVATSGGQAGIDALHAAVRRSEPFAAVITDLGMPYVDGRKVAAAVKNASPATPVILLSGWGQRLIAEDDIPAHVDRVLPKPPKLRDLRETLAALCRPPSTGASA